MLEDLITFGYVFGAIGFVCCVIGYFVFPKLLKTLTEESNDGE